ncbi:MAG: helicase HerA domain-containing protein [Myxococcota bacterium]
MTTGLELMQLMKSNYVTTYQADKLNNEFMNRLGLSNRYGPARLAIARSLAVSTVPPVVSSGSASDGKPIHGQQLFGDELKLWVALIVEHAGHELTTLTEFKDLVRRHWARGIDLLHQEWQRSGESFDKFILLLAQQSGSLLIPRAVGKGEDGSPLEGGMAQTVGALTVQLGMGLLSGGEKKPMSWTLNAAGNSPHVAIMGATGAGKTRAANQLIKQLKSQAQCPVILFDMGKGDLAADVALVQHLNAKVLRSPAEPIPLDILQLESSDETTLLNVAVRFRESFEKVSTSRLGGQQRDAVREAALQALRKHRPTQLENVRDALAQVYDERGRKPDSVNAAFNELTGWKLFQPTMGPAEFFNQSWILDLHEATETAQRLIVFLVLDSLYRWQSRLPDAPIASGSQHRALRLLVGIDEARKVLGYRHDALKGLVRESRSKGLSIFLMSQSPDDYHKETDNFLENMGLLLCFRTNAASGSLHAAYGQQADLGGLPPGVCITRLPGHPGLTRIQAWENTP